MPSLPDMQLYWSGSFLAANAFIGLNLLGALVLGMVVGYERSYNGRAAGMRTYGLVCMASTALTIFVGFAPFWYGGAASQVAPDATRVVQGVVTGVGFLCAGVIVKDGLNVSGLTTAASIWAASAIGVLLGVGLYAAALLLSVLCMLSMSVVHQIELKLPGRSIFDVSLSFCPDAAPELEELTQVALAHGYRVMRGSFSVMYSDNVPVWRFCVVSLDRSRSTSPAQMAQGLARSGDVLRFSIVPLKN
ncbi:MgtC/SapB family protein [Variovorax paradoxus]|uniref:MgtC/SapB family protein n=1 Tax=Variovorax paradoxus TaxID=34073 RepID=UPI003D6575AA